MKMSLKVYLAHKGMTVKQFAELIDYHSVYLSLILHGHKSPGPKLVKKIEEATNGMVKEKWIYIPKERC